MNKSTLIAAIAESADISKKDAEKALNATLDVITNALVAEDTVQLVGFGTFSVSQRSERTGRYI